MSENGTMVANAEQLLRIQESIIASRAALAASLGKAFGGDRDYYTTLGYNLTPTTEDYYGRFKRQDIAKRIVEAYPTETWRLHPDIYEDDTEINTEFEKAWNAMSRRLRLFHRFYRADVLACLGRYSVIVLGFNDVSNVDGMSLPVRRSNSLALNHMSSYSERHVDISVFDEDIISPRFGTPLYYEIDFSRGSDLDRSARRAKVGLGKQRVHWERVIHVAQDTLEDDIYGTPKLEPVYNLLDDLYKIVGGSGESFWMNAKRALIAEAESDARFSTSDLTEMQERMDSYIHDYQRTLAVQGTEIKTLQTQIASPRDAFDVVIELIAGTTRIPQRIILGSERGELSSAQDAVTWAEQNQTRQSEFAEPVILRAFIDRCISVRALPTPRNGVDGYTIEWQPLLTEDESAKAERQLKTVQAMAQFADSSAAMIWPPQEVRVDVFGMEPESPYELPDIQDARESQNDDEFMNDEGVNANA